MFLRSRKHHKVNVSVGNFQKVNFANYECFSCIGTACTDFLNNLMKIADEIARSKEIRIKIDMQEWVDRQIAGLIHVHEKLF